MIDYDVLGAISPYTVSFALAYLITEGIKIVSIVVRTREFRWREFFKSGGMPSSHSAIVTALAVTIGMLEGFDSAIFGLAIGFAAVVMYDAMHVRRAVGEQGEVFRKMIERDAKLEAKVSDILNKKPAKKLRKPYFTRGHQPLEVIAGCLMGALIGATVAIVSVI